MPQDFSGKNLRGRNFKGQDLTGANFSYAKLHRANFTKAILENANFDHADIRNANFNNANLTNANFNYAKAGQNRNYAFGTAIVSVLLSLSSGGISTVVSFYIAALLTQNIVTALSIGLAILILLPVTIFTIIKRKSPDLLLWAAIIFTVTFGGGALLLVSALMMTGSAALIVAVAIAWTRTVSAFIGGMFSAFFTMISAAGFLVFSLVVEPNVSPLTVNFAWAITLIVPLIGIYVGWQAIAGNKRYILIRQIAVNFTAKDSTTFRYANLTNANFTHSLLKSTDFSGANITHTCWFESQKLELAIVDGTILTDPVILKLLISKNGNNKSYMDANLRGANLIGADLRGANLKGANISDATFQGANLENANLTLTEAIGTNFTSAQMTGACVEAWNIESNTKLDNVDCRLIYLLEYPIEDPKTGTKNNRERRPSSGEFAPGEFTKLFQEVLTTVDLIFRKGVDWKAFIAAFKKVQVENEDTELTIQSIENKGDGVVVVRVSLPPDTNKEKIHREFTQNYELALKAIEEKYQAKLESKDEQITLYRQQLEDSRQREIRQNSNMEKIIEIIAKTAVNVPVNEREVKALAERQTTLNLVIITLGTGDFEKGFSSVIAQIWTENDRLPTQHSGELLPAPEIVEVYHHWQSQYNCFIEPLKSSRIQKKQGHVTNFSKVDLDKLAEQLEEKLNKWLNAEQFQPIDRILREKFNRYDEIQVIIQSENIHVRRLPWHLWDFLKPYRKAEVALSSPFYDRTLKTAVTRNRIRILSVLGDDKGIDIDKDRQLLAKIDAETSFFVKPNCQQLNEQLWSEQGWDILCFSGHSFSEMDGSNGYIYINDTDKLSIPELKNALLTAIERGLQIAIFNSCDGLGLANQLASLHIPQIIVMREPVPDVVAQEFLKYFLTAFASGKSFYLAVREAREKLQGLEKEKDFPFPCASWLPVICQNPAEIPSTWESLRRSLS